MRGRTDEMGIYVHIPFCLRKCNYCDFFSVSGFSKGILEQYVDALICEIEKSQLEKEYNFSTVYIGGGTPSLLEGKHVERILKALYKKFRLKSDVEITMEANPATLNKGRISHFYDAGINRFSLGVQSFADEELKILGRMHDERDILKTIEFFHELNIENFNIDLIYGIPGQTREKWENNLKKAVDSAPLHISMYLLQLDDSVPMAKLVEKGHLKMLTDEDECNFYYLGLEYLENEGFKQYEISNFSRPGFTCRHNLIYWQAKEYIGIGAGAVSYIDQKRFLNIPGVEKYIKNLSAGFLPPREELEFMDTPEKVAADAVILGLRLCQGINLKEFARRFGIDIKQRYKNIINKYVNADLLKLEDGYIYLTKKGYFLANEVLKEFMV